MKIGRKLLKFTKEEIDKMIYEYQVNLTSLVGIGKMFNCCDTSIRNTLVKNNVKIGIGHERATAKYKIDTSYFEKIDTPNKAYFLGLMYSDGSITYVNNKAKGFSIGLQERDRHILESFLTELKSNHPLTIRNPSNSKKQILGRTAKSKQKICNLRIESIKISNDLIKLGCIPRKSLILEFPSKEQVSDHLIHHFIRGYFDGDGTTHFTKRKTAMFGFVGTYNICSAISNILNEKLSLKFIEPTKIRKDLDKNTYKCYFGGNLTSRIFYNYIYKDAELFLIRKHEVLLKCYTEGGIRGRTSNYRGVFKHGKKWVASLYFNKKNNYLGVCETEIEAANRVQEFIKNNTETSYVMTMPNIENPILII
jgi:hypothetical protein